MYSMLFLLVFFNDSASTEIFTLSLHDALPISPKVFALGTLRRGLPGLGTDCCIGSDGTGSLAPPRLTGRNTPVRGPVPDRKSTRLNSSHANITYAVVCLKKNGCQKNKRV